MDATDLKVVFVGNTNVGKTCVVKMATTGTFGDDTVATLGASYVSKMVTVDKTDARLQIWDTAGQERYRGMTPMYFRGANVAIVMYSITDQESFDSIDSWVESLKENAEPNVVIFLIGNKCDLEDERRVSLEDGQHKADEIRATFMEVSAKTGYQIDTLFLEATKAYLEKNPGMIVTDISTTVPLRGRESAKKGQCC